MNKIKLIIILLICLFSFQSKGQNLTNRKLIKIVRKAPDSIINFPSDIADYFKTKTENPKELVFLFSYWIGQNISYDVEKYLNNDITYGKKCIGYKMNPESAVDINDMLDFEFAEYFFKKNNK